MNIENIKTLLSSFLTESLDSKFTLDSMNLLELSGGLSRQTFKIETPINDYVIHLKQGPLTTQSIRANRFHKILNEEGLPTSNVIGKSFYIPKITSSAKVCEFIDGIHLKNFNEEQSYNMGLVMSQMHALGKVYYDEIFNKDDLITKNITPVPTRYIIKNIRTFSKGISQYLSDASMGKTKFFADDLIAGTKVYFGKKIYDRNLPKGIAHGDVHRLNVFYDKDDNDKVKSVIDFEHVNIKTFIEEISKFAYRDLFTTKTQEGDLNFTPDNVIALLKGYSEFRKIEPDELAVLPYKIIEHSQRRMAGIIFRWGEYSEEEKKDICSLNKIVKSEAKNLDLSSALGANKFFTTNANSTIQK